MRNKYFYLITVVMLSCTMLIGCGKEKNSEKEKRKREDTILLIIKLSKEIRYEKKIFKFNDGSYDRLHNIYRLW